MYIMTIIILFHLFFLQRISCKNEAEFCSYDILLHLNDGNVFK